MLTEFNPTLHYSSLFYTLFSHQSEEREMFGDESGNNNESGGHHDGDDNYDLCMTQVIPHNSAAMSNQQVVDDLAEDVNGGGWRGANSESIRELVAQRMNPVGSLLHPPRHLIPHIPHYL
jgi:hypothetical protein